MLLPDSVSLLVLYTLALSNNIKRNAAQVMPVVDKIHIRPPWEVSDNITRTEILATITISQIRSLLYDAELTFELQQNWYDSRFVNDTLGPEDFVIFNGEDFKFLWRPDTFIANELPNGVFETTPTDNVKAYSNGSMHQNTRHSIIFHCNVKWFALPMNDEICSLRFKSASYSNAVLKLVWNPNSSVIYSKSFISHSVENRRTEALTCYDQNDVDSVPCLELKLHLKRLHNVRFIQVYLPSTCIILITWFGFWIHHTEVSGRTRVVTVCLVAITAESLAVMIINPEQNHMEPIEGWIAGCIILVTLAFLEYIVVHNIHLKHMRIMEQGSNLKPNEQEENKRNTVGTSLARSHRRSRSSVVAPIMVESQSTEHSLETKKQKLKPETIDHLSKLAFPVLFIIFNIIYWVYFMA